MRKKKKKRFFQCNLEMVSSWLSSFSSCRLKKGQIPCSESLLLDACWCSLWVIHHEVLSGGDGPQPAERQVQVSGLLPSALTAQHPRGTQHRKLSKQRKPEPEWKYYGIEINVVLTRYITEMQ